MRNRASVKIIAAVKKAQEIRQQVMEEKMRVRMIHDYGENLLLNVF